MANGPFKMKYKGSSFPFKSSPAKGTPSATHTHPHMMSESEKKDIEDMKVIEKSQDPTKVGGKGSRPKDQPTTTKAIKRQILRDKDELSRKELLKSSKQAHLARGGKGGSESTVTGGRSRLRRALTSTKTLRKEDIVRRLRGARAEGQAEERENI